MVLGLQTSVQGTTKLSCQGLVSVAALSGVLRHPALATHSCHPPKTASNLTKEIQKAFGCSTADQAIQVIHAVSFALEITSSISERIFSTMLLGESLDSSHDCYFPGQTFFKVEGDRVLQLFPDGASMFLEPIALKEDGSRPSTRRQNTSSSAPLRSISPNKRVEKRAHDPLHSRPLSFDFGYWLLFCFCWCLVSDSDSARALGG
jgi:hypothetical protein